MMKKIAVLFISLILALGIIGCGSSTTKTEESAKTAVSSKTESTVTEAAAAASENKETAKEEPEDSEEPVSKTVETTAEVPESEEVLDCPLEDGVYSADFNTDSSMFHVNESCDGKGVLTVKDGKMTLHVSLVSKNIVNLFVGTAEEAQADGAVLLEPTTDEVTYSDGITEEVYGFDIPVFALDEEFDCALIGKKGKWYDHKVSVSNAEPLAE